MLDSTLLGVVIGLVLFYALLSVIVSSINEFLVSMIGTRGKNLARGIRTMLNDPDGKDLAEKVLNSPTITGLKAPGKSSGSASRLPSYLPSQTFVTALIRALIGPDGSHKVPVISDIEAAVNKIDDTDLKHRLQDLLNEANGDIEKFKAAAENWYNNVMDRVSGWYKRQISWILLGLSILIVSLLNADTIVMIDALINDSTLRNSLVEQAETAVQNMPDIAKSTLELDSNGLASMPIDSSFARVEQGMNFTTEQLNHLDLFGWKASPYLTNKLPENFFGWVQKVIGLLLTAMAISLGAPFWFDVLSKVSRLRGSGTPPPEVVTVEGNTVNPSVQSGIPAGVALVAAKNLGATSAQSQPQVAVQDPPATPGQQQGNV